MKNKKILLSVFIACILILASCSTIENKDMKGHISSIQDAVKKSTKLKNGEFSYQVIIEGEGEKQTIVTKGQFAVHKDAVDWRTALHLGEADSDMKTITEGIQKDKIQYERLGKINSDHEFIGDDNEPLAEEPEWQVLSENATDYPSDLQPLMHLKLNQANKTIVDVKKENEHTIYTFTYNDAYLLDQKESNIRDIKKQLENAKKENAESYRLAALEEFLAYNEKMIYTGIQLILTVDHDGVLIEKAVKSTFQPTDEEGAETLHMTNAVKISAYNQTDMKIDF